MILLRSNAHHIYWLGRYLCRVDYFAKQLSSIEKQQKENSIQFFGLHFDDIQQLNEFMLDRQHPNSLISLLEKVIDNIHALRAVLGSDCYAQLNDLIKTTEKANFFTQDLPDFLLKVKLLQLNSTDLKELVSVIKNNDYENQ